MTLSSLKVGIQKETNIRVAFCLPLILRIIQNIILHNSQGYGHVFYLVFVYIDSQLIDFARIIEEGCSNETAIYYTMMFNRLSKKI